MLRPGTRTDPKTSATVAAKAPVWQDLWLLPASRTRNARRCCGGSRRVEARRWPGIAVADVCLRGSRGAQFAGAKTTFQSFFMLIRPQPFALY